MSTTRVLLPASPDGPAVPAVLHEPVGWGAGDGCIVWAHGGSWHHGSASDWRRATMALAELSGLRVLSLDYRLAPVHRHPDAVIDVLTAITWLNDTRPAEPIVVGGDSAGGTLATLAALVARDRGVRLEAQLLAYPPIDPRCRADSYHKNPDEFPSSSLLRAAWRSWLGEPVEPALTVDGIRIPLSPLAAETLRGVARVVLVVGEHDPVRDDVAAYAAALIEAGVSVDHRILSGAGHGEVSCPDSIALVALAEALTVSR